MNPAKQYYEEFNKINPERLGPYVVNLTKHQRHQLLTLRKTYIEAIQRDIKQSKNDIDHGEIFVPSPWHAWALLTESHLKLISIEEASVNKPFNYAVPVYRGQNNADYPPIPSLYRSGIDRNYEQRCLEAFSFIFNQEFLWGRFGISLPLDSAKATAQHYGIKTDLLDVTADPSIAIYFASQSNNRTHGDTAAVYIFDLQHFLQSGIKLILPPPIVERLYSQRGAFLSFPESAIAQSHKKMLKLSFPFDSSFKLFENTKKNIMNTNDWLARAIEWAKEWAKNGKSLPNNPTDINHLLCMIFEKIEYPNFYLVNNSPDLTLLHWLKNIEDMMYWYDIRLSSDKEKLLSGIWHEIVQSNTEIIQFMIEMRSRQHN